MGMDCDKGQFSLEKPSPIVTRSHLPPIESSNLKNNVPPIFIIVTCKKNEHPTLLQTDNSLIVPSEYHGS
jgi:hypothetical protein